MHPPQDPPSIVESGKTLDRMQELSPIDSRISARDDPVTASNQGQNIALERDEVIVRNLGLQIGGGRTRLRSVRSDGEARIYSIMECCNINVQ